jgi:hypothetical protein
LKKNSNVKKQVLELTEKIITLYYLGTTNSSLFQLLSPIAETWQQTVSIPDGRPHEFFTTACRSP